MPNIGQIAGLITLFGFILYGIETILRKRRPNRASWLVWSFMTSLLVASSWIEGAHETLPYLAADFAGYFILWILSMLVSADNEWTYIEKLCVLVSIICMPLMFWSGFVSILALLFVDFIGTIPTFKDPSHEPIVAWPIFCLGAFLNILAIDSQSLSIIIPPWYFFICLGVMVIRVWSVRWRIMRAKGRERS